MKPPDRPWLELLSHRFRVIAPWHPGYGKSPLIDGSGSVDDLAYLYLDLATELGFENAILVGACFGGWVAAEMMVRSTARFSHLVLVERGAIPGARLEIIPRAGHFPHWEQPEEFAERLSAFVGASG